MDFACFSSLFKLGIDCPTKGFTPLQEIFEQVDNERVAAAKQAATPTPAPAPASVQKSRSLHDKRSDDVTYTTPVHSSKKHESNPRVPPDSGQTGEGSVHVSAERAALPSLPHEWQRSLHTLRRFLPSTYRSVSGLPHLHWTYSATKRNTSSCSCAASWWPVRYAAPAPLQELSVESSSAMYLTSHASGRKMLRATAEELCRRVFRCLFRLSTAQSSGGMR